MKLLICTQTVDAEDPILGFFCRWIEEFARYCDHVTVICLRKGAYELPSNVEVLSLGKERGVSRLRRGARFIRYVIEKNKSYDAVFVHMNPEYLVLAGALWTLMGKKISLWYTHRDVNLKLRIAAFFAQRIFTASPESFRLRNRKVEAMGHGIDTELFSCERSSVQSAVRMITVGRISQSKKIEILLDAAQIVSKDTLVTCFDIVGEAITPSDREYETTLKNHAQSLSIGSAVHWLGSRSQKQVAKLLCGYDVFMHASTGTGSLDKAALEAMSCGLLVVSSSPAFKDILEPYGLYATANSPQALADAIHKAEDPVALSLKLKEYVRRHHSLQNLIPKLVKTITT